MAGSPVLIKSWNELILGVRLKGCDSRDRTFRSGDLVAVLCCSLTSILAPSSSSHPCLLPPSGPLDDNLLAHTSLKSCPGPGGHWAGTCLMKTVFNNICRKPCPAWTGSPTKCAVMSGSCQGLGMLSTPNVFTEN